MQRTTTIPSRAWVIFILCAATFTMSMFYRTSAAVIAPQLTHDLGLDSEQLGLLSASFFYAFAFCQIALALTLDRVGARFAMSLGAAIGVCGALLFATADTPGMAILGRILLGMGMSANMMGPLALLAAWFGPGVFATLGGIMVSIGNMGGMISGTPLALLTQSLGWRMTFVLMAGLNAALGLAVALLVRNRPDDQPAPSRQKSMFSGVRALVTLPSYWAISLATFFRYGIIMALQGLWVGPWLTYGLGLSQIQAGNAILYLALSQVIGLPIFGMISDRVARSRKKIILPSMIVMTLLIGCMVLFQRGMNTWVVYGFCLFLGLSSCPGQILYAHIKELMPPESAGAAMTGINLFTMLGPATLIQVAGMLVADEPSHLTGPEGFNPVWWMMFGGLALACLAYTFVPDSKALKSQ